MIRRLLLHLAVVLLPALQAVSAMAADDPAYVPGRVIVKYRETEPAGALPLPAQMGAAVERRFRSGAQLLRIRGMSVEDAVALLTADPRIEYAEPDYLVSIDQSGRVVPDDPRFNEQYGLDNAGQTGGTVDADVDAAEAWAIRTGSDVLIGVIDTGVDWRHEDLAANIWTNPGEIPDNDVDDDRNGFVDDVHGWDFVNNDNDPTDDNMHGTHVAGIIAAVGNNGVGVSGVCWSVRLLPVKILNGNGIGSMSEAIAGIEYAALMGARVTNNSWGSTSYSRALDDALAGIVNTGTLMIAAAGNSRRSTDLFPHYPSSLDYDYIVSVANTDHKDTLSIASNYGFVSVDLSAPGDFILSTVPGNGYDYLTGTSMATPHVTGAAALILAEAPLMTVAAVKALLLDTVDPVPALRDRVASEGRLNIHRALLALDDTPPGRIDDLKVVETGSNTVTLEWTAPGDDGDVGTASAYELRFADQPIKLDTFDAAAHVDGVPAPEPAGTVQRFRVDALDVKTTYFFAMRAVDERLHVSPMSKMAAGRTRSTPDVSLEPGSFSGAALSGAVVEQTLRVSNDGKGSIDFEIAPGAGGWARAEPNSGAVRARETVEVTVRFDALGLAGGSYDDAVVIKSNDPDMPTATLAVHLDVTSAPHAVVLDSEVDFGDLFVGVGVRRDVRVVNLGDRPLSVTSVGVDDADAGFDVDVEPFTLAPGEERALAAVFAPAVAGTAAAHLHVSSDDPDGPEVVVALSGRGLPPPDVAIAPEGFTAEMHSGAVHDGVLTIHNHGLSDLVWNLVVDADTVAADPGDVPSGETPPGDLSGVRILYDQAHHNLHWFNYIMLFTDFRDRGADVVIDDSLFTRAYLDRFDVVWMAECWEPMTGDELDVLTDWVRAGGGLLLEGDYDRSLPKFHAIQRALLTGIEFSYENGVSGLTLNIERHATTRGVADLFLDRVQSTIVGVERPARPLVFDAEGVCNVAWSRSGVGRVVVLLDQDFGNNRMGLTGNRLFGNRVVEWLARGAAWVNVSTSYGVVAPQASQQVDVQIDAIALAGSHDVRLTIRTNDPDSRVLTVPVQLDATPAPDVVAHPSVLRLHTPVTETAVDSVWIGNIGTAPLAVTSVSSSSARFAVAPTAFDVAAGAAVALHVTWTPSGPGQDAATITVESNDPDTPAISIGVFGEAFVDTTAGVAAVVGPAGAPALERRDVTPERTSLHPNVPNPFNPITTIAYDLHVGSPVTVVVYDVRGRLVRTLVDADKPPGIYDVTWDGTNDAGQSVATGVYFCRLVAGAVTQTRKMVLLK